MGSRLEKRSKEYVKSIEAHKAAGEDAEQYSESKFGDFGNYMRRKKTKLQDVDAELREKTLDNPRIFKGVVAAVNGYTQPSMNDLHRLIVSYGGGFLQYLDGKTSATHIIASALTPKKAVEFRRYRIVKPAWVLDSIAAGKLLPWENYRVVDEGVKQKILQFGDGKLGAGFNDNSRAYRDQMENSWYTERMRRQAEFIEDDREGYHVVTSKGFRKDDLPTAAGGQTQTQTQTQKGKFVKGKAEEDEIEDSKDENLATQVKPQPPKASNEDYGFTSSWEDAMREVPPVEQLKKDSPNVKSEEPNMVKDSFSVKEEAQSSKEEPTGRLYSATPYKQPTTDNGALKRSASPPRALKRSRSPSISSPSKRQRPMTEAEKHNAQLLKDPKLRQSTTANPDFLKQFYSESRLHHLSTWKADLKAKFQSLADAQTPSQARLAFKRKPGARRYIMHVDFDSFFCAVSLLSAPEYKDKPAVVAHGPGPGAEIASCNYPARKFGVKNGMWMKRALQLCPEIKVLPYDFKAYEAASEKFYQAILEIGGVVQSISIDECLVDITSLVLPAGGSDGLGVGEGSLWREQERADQLGNAVRQKVKERTGCEVSVGIGANILLAKVALRKAKPAGLYQIRPEEVLDFIGDLTVQDLPGIAYSIGGKLEEMGIKFVKDVRGVTKDRLMTVLGPKTGEKIWDYSRGIDKTEVGQEVTRKSVSAEVNWGIRFTNQTEAEDFIMNLCGELAKRLAGINVKGRQLTMKIMRKAADAPLDPPKHLGHGKCDVFNKSVVLGVATNEQEVLGREAISILRSFNFPPGELRGIGAQMTKLEPIKVGQVEPSQKRLSFAKAPQPRKQRSPVMDDPIDDPITPQKPKSKPTPSTAKFSARPSTGARPGQGDIEDIDPDSPVKPRETPIHPAQWINKMHENDPSAKKMNMWGTQFLLPTQVDQKVLNELPMDIRSMLVKQGKGRSGSSSRASETPSKPSSKAASRQGSPFVGNQLEMAEDEATGAKKGYEGALPEGVDPEVFADLPPDLQAEVLAQYGISPDAPAPARHSSEVSSRAPSLAPQSPRKPAKLGFTKPTAPPGGKKLVRLLQRGKKPSTKSKLTQASFVVNKNANQGEAYVYEDAEIDPEYLASLPESMRAEVLRDHRAQRMRARASLKADIRQTRRPEAPREPQRKKVIELPPKKAKPAFTVEKLVSLEEIREVVREWVEEFEEGPEEEDGTALARWLRKVVLGGDAGKAVAVVGWLEWCVKDKSAGVEEGKREVVQIRWRGLVERCKLYVRDAAGERGMGKVDFDV